MAKSYCTEENSAEVVVTQRTNAKTQRIGEVISILTRYLPAAIKKFNRHRMNGYQPSNF